MEEVTEKVVEHRVKAHLNERELMDMIEHEDPRYIPLTPKHWQNGLSQKSQVKHWEAKKWKWEAENKEAEKNNGKLLKEYIFKQRRGEL
tara:strand:+ start:770 stop:1036 length:267 start_codon:yes stop_codon:yes gene_type:complete